MKYAHAIRNGRYLLKWSTPFVTTHQRGARFPSNTRQPPRRSARWVCRHSKDPPSPPRPGTPPRTPRPRRRRFRPPPRRRPSRPLPPPPPRRRRRRRAPRRRRLADAAAFVAAFASAAACLALRTAACLIHHSGWNRTSTGVRLSTTCAAASMKHANPNHSVRRSHAACRSSRDNERPPPASAARCSPAYSSPVLRMVALLSSSAASVRRPFSSSSPTSARPRSESVLCAASATRRLSDARLPRDSRAAVGGDAVAVRVAHAPRSRRRPSRAAALPEAPRAPAVACGERDRGHGEPAATGARRRARRRAPPARRAPRLCPGRTCSPRWPRARGARGRAGETSRACAAASALGADPPPPRLS